MATESANFVLVNIDVASLDPLIRSTRREHPHSIEDEAMASKRYTRASTVENKSGSVPSSASLERA
jgi:hypothetical protein